MFNHHSDCFDQNLSSNAKCVINDRLLTDTSLIGIDFIFSAAFHQCGLCCKHTEAFWIKATSVLSTRDAGECFYVVRE